MSEEPLAAAPVIAAPAWEATQAAWAKTMPGLGEHLAPRESRHSYGVLAGLTSSGGGMVAAATMSLPERAEAGRNYDYRYVWIRDQCYTGQAIAADGPHRLLDDAVAFVAARLLDDGPELKPAYTVTGGPVPDERVVPGLPGYPGGSAKVGNWVNKQFQLDAFGEALLLFAAAARHDHLDSWHWRAVEAAVAAIKARHGDPDAGLWELDDRRWTHSRLTCVAGLRAIASAGAAARQAGEWEALADGLLASAAQDGLHPDGDWQRAPGDERTDAALLLPAIRGATPAADPRALATLAAVQDDLARDGYLYRFRHDQRPLHDAEGAFVLCGFVMALALHQQGRHREAVGWFERNRAACGPPRAVHRGIRRRPAAAARQHPAGVRPRAGLRGLGAAGPDLGAAVRPGGPAGPRRLCLARAALGVAYLTWAGTGRRAAPAGPVAAVLAGRHLAQAALTWRLPTRAVLTLGAAVHAATRWRPPVPPALGDALVETALAGAGLTCARTCDSTADTRDPT